VVHVMLNSDVQRRLSLQVFKVHGCTRNQQHLRQRAPLVSVCTLRPHALVALLAAARALVRSVPLT
jgi:hypothetical protein